MHPRAVEEIVASVRRRITQGDRPTEPPQPREVLEEALLELAGPSVKLRFSNEGLRNKLASDPDDEPMAGATLSAPTEPCDPPYRPAGIVEAEQLLTSWYDGEHPHYSTGVFLGLLPPGAADSATAVQPERCCLDYPRCDCNSPPEPDDDWLCFQRPPQPKVTHER